jgi:hypothetical protein
MKKINWKKVEKASFIAISLAIAFVANKWFEQAWALKTDIGKWGSFIIALIFLIIAIYPWIPANKN